MEKESAKREARTKILDRRKFITGMATTAASFTIVKSSLVRGSQANSKVEVGCIGLGGRGNLIANMLAEHEGFQVVSVADYFAEGAQRAGDRLNVPKSRRFSGLSGYKKLIASKVDAVFLETPPCFFPEHAAAAVEAGCHVYVAKPVAVDVPGCLSIAELGKKSTRDKRVFMVDFQTRTDPFNIEAVKRCHEGLIGKVSLLSSIYTDDGFSDPPKTKTIESRLQSLIWVYDIELGGGMIVNCDIHAVDLALWIAGARPTRAMGCSRRARPEPHGDTFDVYSVTYEFENGLVLNHHGEHLRNTHDFVCRCVAYGQDGYMETDYDGKASIRGNKGGYKGGVVENLYVSGISRNLDTFHKSIVNGVYDNPTVESSVNSTLATILGREAGRRNTMMTWDQMIKENRRIEPDLTGLKQ
jgi:myo-inositol 2-dehydrogenase/D-chiro-inositol 1-dehydrogenase